MALDAIDAYRPAITVTDLRLGADWGIELVRDIKVIEPATRLVLLSGWVTIATTAEAMRAGCELVLAKPVHPVELQGRLEEGDDDDGDLGPCRERPPSLARATYEHAMRVFTDARGNMSEAARRLGVHRQSLQRLLRKPPER
jgi:two-component system response regulator RegA